MHGHGYAPPPSQRPADGTLIALRVLFSAMTFLSCGFLGWAPMLRLAVVTRRTLDWFLFCAVLLLNIGLLVFLVAVTPEGENAEISDGDAAIMVVWMLAVIIGVIAYYLTAEINHFNRLAAAPPPGYGTTHTGYGYPPAAQLSARQTYPTQPQPPAVTAPAGPPPQQQQPQPPQPPQQPPVKPTSQRIDQVRAELDELSDLLRNEPRDPRDGDR
ncbi:hypothetical protein E2C00_09365 [Streptomyces sp. WAC05374]|uniref:hypothetical protein n=1 Tax=Streptomyces sp. WAC05374 TaxID=2487420 RepID=UPI000F88C94E|nr:hypothetical protein [Streptomyces sp. WAC05374]RST01331.1 hypothetical protein EF905_35215 [Streptomyces sp. WAC05374]TDF47014.1 hypothetical protein E2B92_08195 [Streptomyces sp. WAC05374]TDF57269.1 hypothetical protein E2C00_09365 [Streptomyces sp. WAC05374]TDF61372.1 hypothetical protein E2C02_00555 [Streptomyces sp. WAC05374]